MIEIDDRINQLFEPLVKALSQVLFWDPIQFLGFDIGAPAPIVVIWLMLGGLFFTIRMRFVNFRAFGRGIREAIGKSKANSLQGEVTPFQALTTALSATIGLGNIAGVAVAIGWGGPGATFWMIMAGLLGMSLKFTECTLGVKYRHVDANRKVSGGPMYYLHKGLAQKGFGRLGRVLAILFAFLVMGGSIGGGNMFQANQAFSQFTYIFPDFISKGYLFGTALALLVGLVVIGGIKGIARVTSRLVPIMALLYVGTALVIIGINFNHVGDAFSQIFEGAFGIDAMSGGFFGALFIGFQRGAFSNEAGIGSSPIAHAAARNNEPISEGMVALLEPFIDTVAVCTMTALVLIFTGFHSNPEGLQGAQLTSAAFGSVLPWFPYILAICILLFAYSTMISWSYYGLKGFNYLFGPYIARLTGNSKVSDIAFYVLFLGCTVIGASSSLNAVIDFSDMMILGMAFPNIIGLLFFSNEIAADLRIYLNKSKEKKHHD